MKANDTQSEKLMVRNALKQKCVSVAWIPLLLFTKDYKCGQKLRLNIQGVPEKTHFQNATERPRDKNGRTDPRAHSEIPIIMTIDH